MKTLFCESMMDEFGHLACAIWNVSLDGRQRQKMLYFGRPGSAVKFRFADGKTMHVVFDKIDQWFRFAIMRPGAIPEWNPGLVYFR